MGITGSMGEFMGLSELVYLIRPQDRVPYPTLRDQYAAKDKNRVLRLVLPLVFDRCLCETSE